MKQKFLSVQNMALMAIFVALMAVCSWISLTFGQITFTLQTFAVFVTAGLLGTKKGTLSVVIYILLGAVGVPVFAGFSGGVASIAGYLGGFIIGFIPEAFIIGIATDLIKTKNEIMKMVVLAVSMLIGDVVCFLLGGIWFKQVLEVDWKYTFAMAMAPYIVPDLVKIVLATIIVNRVKKYAKIFN